MITHRDIGDSAGSKGGGVCDTRPTHRDEAGDDDDDEKKKREQAWLRNDLI